MGYMEEYRKWMESPALTDAERAELAALEGDEKEIEDRFYTELSFGTAGMRGVLGAGMNRMNRYNVRRATKGLAKYLLQKPEEAKRGMKSTRFWLLANALIATGKAAAPHVRFFSSAYQTFQEPPSGVAPDPRAEVDFCLHHRCYLHSIGDKRCELNERYRKILAGWHRGGRSVLTYEYTDILPRGEV